jgi:class III poly(R)-hydroxyalkanoic acid synthase PhaE subunit
MADPDTTHPQTLPFLKAWDNYVAASQILVERLSDGSAAHAGAPMPLSFIGPWKDFAASLGMRSDFPGGEHFKPEDLFGSHLPAFGNSREYQETGRRMQDLAAQFQRRCAEFAQQGVDIGQSALQAIQKRSSGDPAMLGSPAALYDAWIDGAEEAYARAARSEQFVRLLADLCNILSAFKIERGKLLEALARHLDWPSRAEVDSLHRQVRVLTAAAKPVAASKPAAAAKPAARKARPAIPKARKRAGK